MLTFLLLTLTWPWFINCLAAKTVGVNFPLYITVSSLVSKSEIKFSVVSPFFFRAFL